MEPKTGSENRSLGACKSGGDFAKQRGVQGRVSSECDPEARWNTVGGREEKLLIMSKPTRLLLALALVFGALGFSGLLIPMHEGLAKGFMGVSLAVSMISEIVHRASLN